MNRNLKLSLAACLCLATPLLHADSPPVTAEDATPSELANDPSGAQPLPTEVLAKLSPEDIKEILLNRQDAVVRLERIRNSHDDPNEGKVAILVPLFFFMFLALAVLATVIFRVWKVRVLHKTLEAMIEKGVNIPPELIAPPNARPNDLRRGLTLMAGGLGGALFGLFVDGFSSGYWSAGLIPLLVGAGYLLAWWAERQSTNVRDEPMVRSV